VRLLVRGLSSGAATVAVSVGIAVGLAAPAIAGVTPPPDPQVAGPLTLCDGQGNQVTSGSLATKPAIYRAIGAASAPKGYRVGGTATLYAFQPRPNVPPPEWSPQQLTGSARFSDADHPMAAGTILDESFATYLKDFPLAAEGVFQVRMYLGAPGAPALRSTYNASYFSVSDGRWTQLHPGADDCKGSGSAVSIETATLPKKKFRQAQRKYDAAVAAGSPRPSTSGGSTASSGNGDSSSTADSPQAPAGARPVSDASASSSHTGRNLTVVLIIAMLALGGGGLALRRRS